MHLFEDIGLALVDQAVKLFLTAKLVDFELTLEFLLLFDLFLGRTQVSFEVDQEIWLLNHLQSLLQFIVFLHKIDNGFISGLKVLLREAHISSNTSIASKGASRRRGVQATTLAASHTVTRYALRTAKALLR